MEVNIDLKNLRKFDLLLTYYDPENSSWDGFNPTISNYVRVEKLPGEYYYYILESYKYENGNQARHYYNLDIIRTLKEKGMLNHEFNVKRYTNVLPMTSEQENYFWRNQGVKLNANVRESIDNAGIKYSNNDNVQRVWENIKWIYIWLQPRKKQTASEHDEDISYQYMFEKQILENIIDVISTALPLNQEWRKAKWFEPQDPGFYAYPVGQLYKATDTNLYYRFIEERRVTGKNDFGMLIYDTFRRFESVTDFNYSLVKYYLPDIPYVEITNLPNNLYCLVVPTVDIEVLGFWYGGGIIPSYSQKIRSWSVDNILPYLFDIDSNNNWNNYIADIKISNLPPFDLNDSTIWMSTKYNSTQPQINMQLQDINDNFSPLKTLTDKTITVSDTQIEDTKIFLPFLRNKPAELLELELENGLPLVNKENTVYKKYMLSVVEQRVELDIPLLRNDNATHLYYYEDISPGRNNIMIGYAPRFENPKETIYYLIHSPNTIIMTRDTTLPIFTDAYQSYVASNKNFIQQAELQRNTQLQQALIQSGASLVGSAAVGLTMKEYNPTASVLNSVGGAVNAFIAKDAQEKNFRWSLENMKSAPGNYKAAAATLSFMLTLDIYDVWIETFRSNNFDIVMFDNIIVNLGFEYFDFPYRLSVVLDNAYQGVGQKRFLQGRLTGITFTPTLNMPLLNILQQHLEEGVNIFL